MQDILDSYFIRNEASSFTNLRFDNLLDRLEWDFPNSQMVIYSKLLTDNRTTALRIPLSFLPRHPVYLINIPANIYLIHAGSRKIEVTVSVP